MIKEEVLEKVLLSNMEDIKKLTNSIIKPFGHFSRFFDMEDLYQEAYIAYMSAFGTYKENRGASLRTYSAKVIRNHLMDIMRAGKLKNSYNEIPFWEDDSFVENEVFMMEQSYSRGKIKRGYIDSNYEAVEYKILNEQLDESLQQISKESRETIRYGIYAIQQLKNGKSMSEIAKELGIKSNYLSVCVDRARKRIKKDIGFLDIDVDD